MAQKPSTTKKRDKKFVSTAVAHIYATFNNTIISFADIQGNVFAASSAGRCGFKGARKSTPFAGQVTATEVGKVAMEYGIKALGVEVKGPGSGRESALRALQALGLPITYIKDVTPLPHNGCRPPKRRRV